MTATLTEQIHLRREVMQPTEVRLHHVPDWLRLACLHRLPRPNVPGYRDASGWGVVNDCIRPAGWLDHWGSTRLGDRVCFVSEPYSVSAQNVRDIEELASLLDCDWWLSSNSWWNPGSTIRIAFAEKRTEGI